jgi:hypothetical protein
VRCDPLSTTLLLKRCRAVTRSLPLAVAFAAVACAGPVLAATGIGEIWQRAHWGEFSDELLRQFGAEATRLPRALDFGDSYVDVVLPSQVVGGVPMVVFFQMDKAMHGLKHVQLERPRQGVSPPAFRARKLVPRLPGSADGRVDPGAVRLNKFGCLNAAEHNPRSRGRAWPVGLQPISVWAAAMSPA